MWLSCALTAEGHSTDDACAVEMEKWKSLNLSDVETERQEQFMLTCDFMCKNMIFELFLLLQPGFLVSIGCE